MNFLIKQIILFCFVYVLFLYLLSNYIKSDAKNYFYGFGLIIFMAGLFNRFCILPIGIERSFNPRVVSQIFQNNYVSFGEFYGKDLKNVITDNGVKVVVGEFFQDDSLSFFCSKPYTKTNVGLLFHKETPKYIGYVNPKIEKIFQNSYSKPYKLIRFNDYVDLIKNFKSKKIQGIIGTEFIFEGFIHNYNHLISNNLLFFEPIEEKEIIFLIRDEKTLDFINDLIEKKQEE